MTRTPSPQTTEGLGATPLTLRWFHVGRPWSNQPGLIYAGAEDPHIGRFVVDCRDWPDETHFGAAQTVDVVALADGIVRDHNARLAAARPSVPSEALAEAVQAAFDKVEAACPVCGGDGWTAEADPSDETGQTPMQVQCWDAEHVVVAEQRAILAALPNREDAPEPRDCGEHQGEMGRKCDHFSSRGREDAPSREGLDRG